VNDAERAPAAPWALVPWAIITAALLVVLWIAVSWQRTQVASGLDQEFATAVTAEAETLAGIANAAATRGDPAPWIAQSANPHRRLTLYAADGHVLADSAGDPAAVSPAERNPEVLQAQSGGQGLDRRAGDGDPEPVLYVAVRLGDGRVLRVAATPTGNGGNLAWWVELGTVMVAAAAVIGFAARMVLDRWRFHELQDVSRAFARGDFARRANLTGTGASGQLGTELNRLGERLAQNATEIATQRSLLDGALGVLDEGVACIDRLDRVVYANAAYRQLAAGGAEVDGQLFYEHVPAAALSAPLARARARVLARGAILSANGSGGAGGAGEKGDKDKLEKGDGTPVEAVKFDHRRRILRVVAVPAGPDIAVVVLHDLTAAHRLEQSRRDFMAAVSHEFKTPLTSLVGYTDTLLDGALEDPTVARSFVERIARHCERLSGLVTDVLTLSRLEQGAWEFRPEPCRLDELLPAVLDEYTALAETKGITLSCAVTDAAPVPAGSNGATAAPATPAAGAQPLPPLTITTDPELLRQLLGNLVSNAIRYNRPNGTVRLKLALPTDSTVAISVADTGIGIPNEHRERVFDRFYRVDAHRSRQTGGTGLGLAIVKQLLAILGGDIGLESGPEGTTFTVTIPRSPAVVRRPGESSGAAAVVTTASIPAPTPTLSKS
jgi:two-component system phosphate regulon sensor histidine kinase PhoR